MWYTHNVLPLKRQSCGVLWLTPVAIRKHHRSQAPQATRCLRLMGTACLRRQWRSQPIRQTQYYLYTEAEEGCLLSAPPHKLLPTGLFMGLECVELTQVWHWASLGAQWYRIRRKRSPCSTADKKESCKKIGILKKEHTFLVLLNILVYVKNLKWVSWNWSHSVGRVASLLGALEEHPSHGLFSF